jgi:Outer membrane protein beta-barrel domain
MPMKPLLVILLLLISVTAMSQTRRTKVPSYFGLQVRPVFPTRFIGEPTVDMMSDDSDSIFATSTLSQKVGYSFGATVRAGLTKLIALETGINFTQRNFNIDMAVPDSNVYANNDISFISYDIPINVLFYVRLEEKWYMNASLGVSVNYIPTHVRVYDPLDGYHEFTHSGYARSKFSFDLNANIGFEFRTEKIGFFYLGGSGRVPFAPLFDMVVDYSWQGYKVKMFGEVDGSYLSIDFKYFFPNIKNKGTQFKPGPIEQ